MKFLQCKKWQISALSMLSWCQKYAQNWWGVIFTKSHTTALTRASLISSFILSATNEAQTFWFAWSAKKKRKRCPWFYERLPCSLQPWKTLLACTPQHLEPSFVLIFSQYPISRPNVYESAAQKTMLCFPEICLLWLHLVINYKTC